MYTYKKLESALTQVFSLSTVHVCIYYKGLSSHSPQAAFFFCRVCILFVQTSSLLLLDPLSGLFGAQIWLLEHPECRCLPGDRCRAALSSWTAGGKADYFQFLARLAYE